MPPRGRKHWCKHCKKSFPSGMSLGGNMMLHRNRRKKQPSSTPSIPSIDAGRHRLHERRRRRWRLSDSTSSDDQLWTLFPKTECHLCFKSFASCDALSMHMIHAHHDKMVVEHKASIGDGDQSATVFAAPGKKKRSEKMVPDTVPTPVMMTYGIEEVDAACILLMLSGGPGMYSASVDCNEDCEMDGNLAYNSRMTAMESNSSGHGLIGNNELMEPETSGSYEELKFGSLTEVLKATTSHECKLCGKVFASGQALGGHKKGHRLTDRDRVSTIPKSAVTQPCRQLLDVDRESFVLNLPDPSNLDYSSMRPNSEPNPWWVASSLQNERMLGLV